MRVAVVAEFYPRRHDPVLGVWAHRQALAAAQAGAEVSVFVLHRVVPPRVDPRALWTLIREPRLARLDGLDVRYVRYASPPRSRAYARWGAYAAPALRRALRRSGHFDLIHAHYAVPAADAVLRAGADVPLIVSVHGGDVLWTSSRVPGGREAVERGLSAARLVLANSAGTEVLSREHGARATRVVHLGTDVPASPGEPAGEPLIATVSHLVARKRHADVLRSLAELPGVRYLIIGDGPERGPLERLASALGVSERVEFAGQLAPAQAAQRVATAWCFVMPSTEEAFGVAYIEAMAAGVPAIGRAGESGPAEIASAGPGLELVEPEALTEGLRRLTSDRAARDALGAAARATVLREFTWPLCGARTLAAYDEALR
ncbi:MAG TPA: glycosyltransferase [Solirubrobacteraceae bacterium]|jgi:glycosyltransferase involved in cell wall biosynthesis|nr:glycosyltransferase [Solirubrobacteraceae bacterium]